VATVAGGPHPVVGRLGVLRPDAEGPYVRDDELMHVPRRHHWTTREAVASNAMRYPALVGIPPDMRLREGVALVQADGVAVEWRGCPPARDGEDPALRGAMQRVMVAAYSSVPHVTEAEREEVTLRFAVECVTMRLALAGAAKPAEAAETVMVRVRDAGAALDDMALQLSNRQIRQCSTAAPISVLLRRVCLFVLQLTDPRGYTWAPGSPVGAPGACGAGGAGEEGATVDA